MSDMFDKIMAGIKPADPAPAPADPAAPAPAGTPQAVPPVQTPEHKGMPSMVYSEEFKKAYDKKA